MTTAANRPLTRGDLLLAILIAALLILLWSVRGVVILGAFALLLAYMLEPWARLLERIPLPRGRKVPRGVSATVVVVVAVGLVATLAAFAIPMLLSQIAQFLQALPQQVEVIGASLRESAIQAGQRAEVDAAIESIRGNMRTIVPQLTAAGLSGLGRLFAQIDQLVNIAVLPVLTFYLLTDQQRVRQSLLSFLPESLRESIHSSTGPVHRALQSYVRGQAVVCLAQGVATGAMLAMAGVPNALLLGVICGIGEILPFLGALIASIAIILSGLTIDPAHAAIGFGIYMLNNWLLQTFVTPRVMERYLKIHPFAVIVSVLAGAQLLGPPGALLALPAAAVLQAVIEDSTKPRKKAAS